MSRFHYSHRAALVVALASSAAPALRAQVCVASNFRGAAGFYNGSTSLLGTSSQAGTGAVTITLTSSANPAVYGAPVTITATVAPAAAGSPTPTGTVSFLDASQPLNIAPNLDQAGRGSLHIPAGGFGCPIFALATGLHSITVSYSGDNNYAGALSANLIPAVSLNQQITKANSSTALGSSQNGLSVTLTASVQISSGGPGGFQDGNPTGTVQFFNGSTLIGTASLSPSSFSFSLWPTATLTTPPITGILMAVYSGDSNYTGSTSPAYLLGSAPFIQQGGKILGSGAVPYGEQGFRVAVSADGNTALVSGYAFNDVGGVWVFTRTNGVWTQQGSKLVGTGAVGQPSQGFSLALSADGNTAIVGGPYDTPLEGSQNFQMGAVWVFTRINGVWTQQGNKLVGTGSVGAAAQGSSVALSADGNTAIVGGIQDNGGIGAAWIFTRNNGVWTQQGRKLVGSGSVSGGGLSSFQGWSVALSADGNTAIVGGPGDNAFVGAVWVFTRSNGIWNQQGNKLVGTGAAGTGGQGWSVAVSADGNTAIEGGPGGHAFIGAVWVFTRSNGVWSQQGNKLTGTGVLGLASVGSSVSISADGNTAVVGSGEGADGVLVFTRNNGAWTQQGSKLLGSGETGLAAQQGTSVALSADGNTLIVGGPWDNGLVGAVWVFVRAPSPPTPPAPVVGKSSVTLTVNSSLFPSTVGQAVAFTVNVSPDSGSAVPTGGVQFVDGTTVLGAPNLINGQATLTTVFNVAGTHSIYAYYSGDSGYYDASIRFGQVVNRLVTSLSLTSSAPTAPFGQPVTFTAQLAPAAPTGVAGPSGQVQFFDGGGAIGTAAVSSGAATLTVSNLAGGAHQITAAYSGDVNWYSVRSAALAETVGAAPTATVLSAVTKLTQVTLTATVNAMAPGSGVPAGNVQFVNATTNAVFGAAALPAGTTSASLVIDASQIAAAAGHPIAAVYGGNANFAPSTSNAIGIPALISATGAPSLMFAPDELVSLFGSNLASTTVQGTTVPLPVSLDSDTVTVTDSVGAVWTSGLYLVSPGQINFVIPSGTAPGTALVTLTRVNAGGGTGVLPIPVTIGAVAPGLFSSGANGQGVAAAQVIRVHADGTQTVENVAAGPIDMGSEPLYLVLYGTGIRNRTSTSSVSCTINGRGLPVAYAGGQSQFPGLDQVDVLLPLSLKGVGRVNVTITVDGQVSNTVRMSFE